MNALDEEVGRILTAESLVIHIMKNEENEV